MTNLVTRFRQTALLDGWNNLVSSEFRGCVVDAEANRFVGALSDSAHFSRCFHKAYGVAPRRYLEA
jgi:hypothetical protein